MAILHLPESRSKSLVDTYPELYMYKRACAECDAISQALREAKAQRGQPITTIKEARQILEGSTIQTAEVRGWERMDHGDPIDPCPTCQYLLDKLGIHFQL
jgi:hypothetical protein